LWGGIGCEKENWRLVLGGEKNGEGRGGCKKKEKDGGGASKSETDLS
jgi:hypothetical protein